MTVRDHGSSIYKGRTCARFRTTAAGELSPTDLVVGLERRASRHFCSGMNTFGGNRHFSFSLFKKVPGQLSAFMLSLGFLFLQYKVWIKPGAEQSFLYGNHVLKSGLGRITENTAQYQGVVVYSMADVPLVSRDSCTLVLQRGEFSVAL